MEHRLILVPSLLQCLRDARRHAELLRMRLKRGKGPVAIFLVRLEYGVPSLTVADSLMGSFGRILSQFRKKAVDNGAQNVINLFVNRTREWESDRRNEGCEEGTRRVTKSPRERGNGEERATDQRQAVRILGYPSRPVTKGLACLPLPPTPRIHPAYRSFTGKGPEGPGGRGRGKGKGKGRGRKGP